MTHDATECIPKQDRYCAVTFADGTTGERAVYMTNSQEWWGLGFIETPENPVIEWRYEGDEE